MVYTRRMRPSLDNLVRLLVLLELEQLHRVPEASSAYLCSSFFEAFLFLFLLCLAQLLNTTTI